MNKKEARLQKIKDLLKDAESIRVIDLATNMHVTVETIRTDLMELEKQNIVVREHGKVRYIKSPHPDPIQIRSYDFSKEKYSLAHYAFQTLEDGQVVYIDSSSTLLSNLDVLQSKKDLTIVTNSILMASKMNAFSHQVILAGGLIAKSDSACHDNYTMAVIDSINFDVAIFGTEGIKNSHGFTTDYSEIAIKRHVISQSKKDIVVCDHSKFEQTHPFCFCTFREIDLLITSRLTEEWRQQVSQVKNIMEIE